MLQKFTAILTPLLVLTFAMAATVAWADQRSDCNQLNDSDRRIP